MNGWSALFVLIGFALIVGVLGLYTGRFLALLVRDREWTILLLVVGLLLILSGIMVESIRIEIG